MEVLKKEVEVSKEAEELAQALLNIVRATKSALDDGWQPILDVPAIMIAAVKVLPSALNGIDQIDDEFRENPSALLNAFLLVGSQLAGEFLKKAPQTES